MAKETINLASFSNLLQSIVSPLELVEILEDIDYSYSQLALRDTEMYFEHEGVAGNRFYLKLLIDTLKETVKASRQETKADS